MSILIRRVLTAALLLLFSSEHVALASTFSDNSAIASHLHKLVEQNTNTLFSLLAEENEERDGKDDFSLPLERELMHPHHFPHVAIGKIPDSRESAPSLRSLPIYTIYCSILI